MKQTLHDSKRYSNFKADRDKALEKILQHTQTDLSRILFEVLEQIENLTANMALRTQSPFHSVHMLSALFDQGIRSIIERAHHTLLVRIKSMRKSVFILTYAGELEAIGRGTKRKPVIGKHTFKQKMNAAVNSPTLMGPIDKRVWGALLKLRGDIIRAFEMAITQDHKPQEVVDAVKKSFPKIKHFKRPPIKLKKVRETRQKIGKDKWIDLDFIDDGDWQDMVDDYMETDLPESRFDNVTEYESPDAEQSQYAWQLEQETNEDFVSQVRDGSIEAANDAGVQDFVWVAIIDDKTDDCCLDRNGKTTSEIEDLLDNGSLSSDDCDAITAPAHFNCRCDNAPVASVDEVEGPDWESFNDWLNS